MTHPERVSRLCLISPDGFATPLNLGARLALLPVVGEPLFRLIGDRALEARIPGYSRDERVVARVQAFLPELRYQGFKRSLISAIRNVPIHGAEPLYRSLDAADVPVEVIWGRQDPVTPMPSEELVRAVFSRADLRLLDGVGHLPHYERPDETRRARLRLPPGEPGTGMSPPSPSARRSRAGEPRGQDVRARSPGRAREERPSRWPGSRSGRPRSRASPAPDR
ncbi:alpha/beta fold hydrolase [Nonomuraea sp. CA-141351]|uniref:alpha/beta fold hydrolase n=1 Tax=Nonomuraea sp. CA-141351 TaxID=3239996 RepID=UPI003D8A7E1A